MSAITLVIAFLYGSMVWGIFPDFFPGKNISYEAHMWGLIAGVVFAIYFRKQGPQRIQYSWEMEDEELENEELDDETGQKKVKVDMHWNAPDNFDDFMFKL